MEHQNDFRACNRILIQTHRPDCIEILKARDYYFDKARKTIVIKILCTVFPFSMAIAFELFRSYTTRIPDKLLDLVTGIVMLVCLCIMHWSSGYISENLHISNILREEYDLRVLGIQPNRCAYDRTHLDEYLKKARCQKDDGKYEQWYREVFCEDHDANVICCQMDNCCYTYYAYKETRIWLQVVMGCLVGIGMIYLLKTEADFLSKTLFVFAMVPLVDSVYSEIQIIKGLVDANKNIIDQVQQMETEGDHTIDIRCIQDRIISNRENSLMLPRIIRNKYLKAGSMPLVRLDQIKGKWMDKIDPERPSENWVPRARKIESSEEIPVLPLSYPYWTHPEEQPPLVPIGEIHRHLLEILADVAAVWEKHGICYTLDGGTLLGAIREKGKFLFWDDDVDLLIPYHQLEQAKAVLRQELGEKYHIQDCDSERYYSPRLSNFRIREDNSRSRVSEKDSPLYREYKMQGLFLDVYAYTPIIGPIWADWIYRFLFLHGRNRKLKKLENKMVFAETAQEREEAREKFCPQKEAYLERVQKYCSRGKSRKYVSYTPNYLENLWKPGPYIPMQAMTGERIQKRWENGVYKVPCQPETVLACVYGKDWNQSPHKTADKLREELRKNRKRKGDARLWYSSDKFCVSVLKHLSCVDLAETPAEEGRSRQS